MKRLHPEERKHIVNHTFKRLQHDWVCRYGQWNTHKLLNELRRFLRCVNKPAMEEITEQPESETRETPEGCLF